MTKHKRAFKRLVARDFLPRREKRKLSGMTLEQLLCSMSDTAAEGQHPFLKMAIGFFSRCCITARNHDGRP